VYVGKNNNKDFSVEKFIKLEQDFGIQNKTIYKNFEVKVSEIRTNVRENFNKLRNKYNKIVGYGSPAKATTSLNYFGIDSTYLDYIVEDNKLKVNKIIPGIRVPIKSINELKTDKPDLVVVMAWNFFDEILKNNQDLVEMGVKFISIMDLHKKELFK